MDPLTEEKTIHKELPDSFVFDEELNELAEPDQGIIIHGDTISFIRNFAVPEDLSSRTFFDHLADMYTPPDQLEILPLKRELLPSHVWNIACLNQYFKKAMTSLDLSGEVPRTSR
ncbi:MAG: hypothetical protein OXF47_11275 [Nitrospira sp.]|nr:hypothetical protein [Nitrospira sp.]